MILKKGAQVKIISGKDKGKTGEILEINRKLEKVNIKSDISSVKENETSQSQENSYENASNNNETEQDDE